MPVNAGSDENDPLTRVYDELRRIAAAYLSRERKNHTLQSTVLVHEAWLRLQKERQLSQLGRTHVLALGAQAMRRILIDYGRRRQRLKRGAGMTAEQLDELLVAGTSHEADIEDLLTLEEALTRYEAIDSRGAAVVRLRFLSGLSSPEVAEHLGVSLRTVESEWAHARAWLKHELAGLDGERPDS
jgi:RNA polymerase sigma factor (TIGR02999 family)